MNGISISQPYADEILSGEKTMEYRKGPVPKDHFNKSLYLLCGGMVLGEIIFIKQSKIKNSDKWIWFVQVLEKYNIPKLYYHPSNCNLFIEDVIVTPLNSGPNL